MTRPVEIKVGNRQAPRGHDYLCVSEDSTGTLQRMIKDAVRENDPGDALIMYDSSSARHGKSLTSQ